eukprot:scaffold7033_cov257-Pinguiococcus_pyrenoidosus.AAC.26
MNRQSSLFRFLRSHAAGSLGCVSWPSHQRPERTIKQHHGTTLSGARRAHGLAQRHPPTHPPTHTPGWTLSQQASLAVLDRSTATRRATALVAVVAIESSTVLVLLTASLGDCAAISLDSDPPSFMHPRRVALSHLLIRRVVHGCARIRQIVVQLVLQLDVVLRRDVRAFEAAREGDVVAESGVRHELQAAGNSLPWARRA